MKFIWIFWLWLLLVRCFLNKEGGNSGNLRHSKLKEEVERLETWVEVKIAGREVGGDGKCRSRGGEEGQE